MERAFTEIKDVDRKSFSKGDPYFYYKTLSSEWGNYFDTLDLIRNVLKHGYDDLALYIANSLYREQNRTHNNMSPEKWENHKTTNFANFPWE